MKPEALIEAVLYIAGEEGISVKELTEVIPYAENEIIEAAANIKKKHENNAYSGLTILETAGRLIMATKKESEPVLRNYAQAPFMKPLSKAALEILAIIAYRQPITRVEIDEIRGVQSGSSLQKLMLRGLVEEKGRVEGPGRPVLYGTSQYFLNYFGLNDVKELPDLPQNEELDLKEIDLFYGTENEEKST